MTNGGNEVNKECVFPFTFKNVKYEACTVNKDTRPWCYTKVDSEGNGVSGEWGYCNENCPSKSLKLHDMKHYVI